MADDVSNTYGPDPLAALSATADLLVLSGTRGTFRVPRSAVTKLGVENSIHGLRPCVFITP